MEEEVDDAMYERNRRERVMRDPFFLSELDLIVQEPRSRVLDEARLALENVPRPRYNAYAYANAVHHTSSSDGSSTPVLNLSVISSPNASGEVSSSSGASEIEDSTDSEDSSEDSSNSGTVLSTQGSDPGSSSATPWISGYPPMVASSSGENPDSSSVISGLLSRREEPMAISIPRSSREGPSSSGAVGLGSSSSAKISSPGDPSSSSATASAVLPGPRSSSTASIPEDPSSSSAVISSPGKDPSSSAAASFHLPGPSSSSGAASIPEDPSSSSAIISSLGMDPSSSVATAPGPSSSSAATAIPKDPGSSSASPGKDPSSSIAASYGLPGPSSSNAAASFPKDPSPSNAIISSPGKDPSSSIAAAIPGPSSSSGNLPGSASTPSSSNAIINLPGLSAATSPPGPQPPIQVHLAPLQVRAPLPQQALVFPHGALRRLQRRVHHQAAGISSGAPPARFQAPPARLLQVASSRVDSAMVRHALARSRTAAKASGY
ncbi:flocculation protein FLO11-like isoform X2 [Selaginella moellendorffii]|uniref:flocculation protein FLO11-like isoform X2 n=1 Tax=Selaginella moellendorffii TaxID=88036 RepID=UPI000D1CA3A1|nr:flocculation protein FLO11-like isoform X2 [Selaginella moellendorffii]XP_024541479.1 flocculation protein FLO11-like isoform X2 [Selaginella moellendorffii]|eukprot:XP_024541360.1 flocculation protein FLO11-like isoform X2 [Selaginella moellendorffii]